MSGYLLAIGAVIVAFIAVSLLGRVVRAWVDERFGCPERGSEYDVVFERRLGRLWNLGPRVDVVRCAALPDPGRITCSRTCLRPKNAT